MRMGMISSMGLAAMAAMAAMPSEPIIVFGGSDYSYGLDMPPLGRIREVWPTHYRERGRRNARYGGQRYAAGRYKGSPAAKRATKRGGNPAAHA